MANRERRRNRLRELLETQSVVIGPIIALSDTVTIELAALAGYEFVCLDAEHGGMSLETVEQHLRVARGLNLASLIRVPARDSNYITRVLDLGVEGIEVPHVKTADDVRWAVSACRFPPQGTRGMYTKGIVADYGLHGFPSLNELAAAVNSEVVVEVIIEDIEGVENIEEIVEVPGLDLVALGPGDLMGDMGLVGQPNHPELQAALAKIYTACKRKGIRTHTTAHTAPKTAQEMRDLGLWMLTTDTDAALLLRGMQADIEHHPKQSDVD